MSEVSPQFVGHVNLLGSSGPLHTGSFEAGEHNNLQSDRLYTAEANWVRETPAAREDLGGLEGAQDYLHSLVHNPKLDRIPGIHAVRGAIVKKDWVTIGHPIMDQYPEIFTNSASATGEASGLPETGDLAGHSRIAFDKSATQPFTYKGVTYPAFSPGGMNHEASHMFLHYTPDMQHAAHGWPMARTHLYITKALLGESAAAHLTRHYNENNVNYGGSL